MRACMRVCARARALRCSMSRYCVLGASLARRVPLAYPTLPYRTTAYPSLPYPSSASSPTRATSLRYCSATPCVSLGFVGWAGGSCSVFLCFNCDPRVKDGLRFGNGSLYPTVPQPTLAYPTLLYRTTAYPSLPYPTLPYHSLPYPTLPYPTVPLPTLAYPTLPYRTTAYPTLPYHSLPLPLPTRA